MAIWLVSWLCPECEDWHDVLMMEKSPDSAAMALLQGLEEIDAEYARRLTMIAVSDAGKGFGKHGTEESK